MALTWLTDVGRPDELFDARVVDPNEARPGQLKADARTLGSGGPLQLRICRSPTYVSIYISAECRLSSLAVVYGFLLLLHLWPLFQNSDIM